MTMTGRKSRHSALASSIITSALITTLMTSAPVSAREATMIGLRGAVAESNSEQSFNAYEAFAKLGLPWGGTATGAHIELTAGQLRAAGESGFLATITPGFTLRSGSALLDIGIGVAYLGQERFGQQDFTDDVQYVARIGGHVQITRHIGIGVMFRHMSNADDDDGDDLNLVLVEVGYQFNK